MNQLTFIDTTLRDGQMSLWATNMRTDMILPIAGVLDRVGFGAVEITATGFEKKLARDLGENLWHRVERVRREMPQTPLRLIRGRHLAAFQVTPQSVERLWWERAAVHGIRQARLADSSNTVAFLKVLVENARRVGIDPIVNLIFSVSPKHTDEYYALKAREVAALQPMRICVKDPGGLLTPERTRTLVPIVQQNSDGIPIEFHTHCNTGLGPICCLEAIKLGIKFINTAIPPLADSSSNPSVFNVVRNARTMGFVSSLNEDELRSIERHFTAIARREGFPIGAPVPYDAFQYVHQIPGGMISNLRHQLANAGLADRLPEVLDEVARVRADLGHPIMVTPYSQFVGVQAAMNVVAGDRYREVSDEIIQYALGFWGEEERSSINANVKDRILDRARARELAGWEPAESPLDDVRRQYGGASLSDDELLLRFLAGKEYVESMSRKTTRSAHSSRGEYLVRLLQSLPQLSSARYITVQKGTGSFTLRNGS